MVPESYYSSSSSSNIFLKRSLPPPPPEKQKICNETDCESAGMQMLNTSNKNDYHWTGAESPAMLTLKSHK